MTNHKRNITLYTTLLLLFVTLLSVIGITIFVLSRFSDPIASLALLQFFRTMRYLIKKLCNIFKKL